jgi:hypothetical protein
MSSLSPSPARRATGGRVSGANPQPFASVLLMSCKTSPNSYPNTFDHGRGYTSLGFSRPRLAPRVRIRRATEVQGCWAPRVLYPAHWRSPDPEAWCAR